MELSFEAGPLAHIYPWQRATTPPPLREDWDGRDAQSKPSVSPEIVVDVAGNAGLAHVFPFLSAPAPPVIESRPDWEATVPEFHSDGAPLDTTELSASTKSLNHVFPLLGAATPPPAGPQVEPVWSERDVEIAPEPEVVPEQLSELPTTNQEIIQPSVENSILVAEPLLADVSPEDMPVLQKSQESFEVSEESSSTPLEVPAIHDISDPVATGSGTRSETDNLPLSVNEATNGSTVGVTAIDDSTTRARAAVPISHAGNRYLLYDTNDITYLRRNHNICGVLIGTLPGHPQQNVFLGTPLELMPEEARLLVEEGAAYIVDDVEAHKAGIMGLNEAERKAFLRALEKQGFDAMKASQKKAMNLKEIAMKKNADKIAAKRKERSETESARTDTAVTDESSSLFAPCSPRPSSPSPSTMSKAEERFYITPSTSHPPLPSPPITPPPSAKLPEAPRSYPLFAYLHSKGYFMTPGLRFGCQYCVYPGDPLRFHSHFLAVGLGWDDEFDLMQVVGGGRLGTGVKKGFLIGGKEENASKGEDEDDVRAFCIEWSGM